MTPSAPPSAHPLTALVGELKFTRCLSDYGPMKADVLLWTRLLISDPNSDLPSGAGWAAAPTTSASVEADSAPGEGRTSS